MRSLLIALAALAFLPISASGMGVSGGGVRTVIAYGDSLWDGGDVEGPLEASGWTVWNAAQNGAEVYQTTADCDGDVIPDPGCGQGIERVLRGGGSGTGECWAAVDVDGDAEDELTCIKDLGVPASVVVLQWGTNDVRLGDANNWSSNRFADFQSAYTSVLDEVEEEGLACVVVHPWPIYESEDGGETYTQENTELREAHDWLEGTALPNYPSCVSVDLYDLFLEYEERYGTDAFLGLYQDCPEKGADAATFDCIHYGSDNALGHDARDIAGEAIRNGIRLARHAEDTVHVVDSEPDGDFDQADLDAAEALCTSPGCRLVLPAETFTGVNWAVDNANVEVIYGSSATLQAEVPQTDTPLRLQTPASVYGLTVDGRKQEQPGECGDGETPGETDGCSTAGQATGGDGIEVEASAAGSTLIGVSTHDVIHHGLHVFADRVRIERGLHEDHGCHTVDTPCPVLDADGPIGGEAQQPNQTATGKAIEFASGVFGGVVRGVVVRRSTKTGIAAVGGASVLVEDSRVEDSMKGLASTNSTMVARNNVVADSGMTGHEQGVDAGQSFYCSGGQSGDRYSGNVSLRSGGDAYQVGCAGAFLEGNAADASCQEAGLADYRATETGSADLSYEGNASTNSLCPRGLHLGGLVDPVVDGGTFSGAYTYGLALSNTSGATLQGNPDFECLMDGNCIAAVWVKSDSSGETIGSFTQTGFDNDLVDQATNEAPVADAGGPYSGDEDTAIAISGSCTDDGLPDPPAAVTSTWTANDCTGTVTFGDANALSTTITVADPQSCNPQLECDDSALTDTDTASLTVNDVGGGDVTAGLTATQTTGPAPFGAVFDAGNGQTTHTSLSGAEIDHRIWYDYTFEGLSGNFPFGFQNPRAEAHGGPMRARVWESAGAYDVTVTGTDAAGDSDSETVQVTVTDPDSTGANGWGDAGETLCVAASETPVAGSGGCPSVADVDQHTGDFEARVETALANGYRRILFKRGDSWTSDGQTPLNVSGPAMLGTYGSGAKAKVSYTNTTESMLEFVSGNPGWRVVGFELEGPGSGSVGPFDCSGGGLDDILLHDLTFTADTWDQMGRVFTPACADGDGQLHDGIVLSELDGVGWSGSGFGANGALLFLALDNSAIVGSRLKDNGNEHNVRIAHAGRMAVENNDLGPQANGTNAIVTVRSNSDDIDECAFDVGLGESTEFVQVSDNVFEGILGGLSDGSACNDEAGTVSSVAATLWEGFLYKDSDTHDPTGNGYIRAFSLNADSTVVRNGLVDETDWESDTGSGHRAIEVNSPTAHVYNVSCATQDSQGNTRCIQGTGLDSVENVVHYAPNASPEALDGSATVTGGNQTLTGASPFSGADFTLPASFIPADGGVLDGAGVVPLLPRLYDVDGDAAPVGSHDVGGQEQ